MTILDTIHQRQSVGKVNQEPVSRELIVKLLDAAVQAPNHYKVRPWRFFVMTGNGRSKLGEVMAASQRDRQPALPPEVFDKTRSLPLRAPVVIAVGVDKPSEPKVLEIENIAAASAACQNILLAAQAQGLGGQWRTGEWARDPQVKKFFGLAEDQHIIGFLYIGYPDHEAGPVNRPGFEDRTTWME